MPLRPHRRHTALLKPLVVAVVLAAMTVAVQVIPPAAAAGPSVLYISGNATRLPAGDLAPHTELVALGYDVTVIDDDVVDSSDVAGRSLVVVGTSVAATKIGSLLTDVPVPLLTWEPFLYDDLGLTAAGAANRGEIVNQTRLDIADPSHPLAAGLSGTVRVGINATNFSFGVPSPDATIAAYAAGRTDRAVIFGYEPGDNMAAGVAPARRVALFPSYATPRHWNDNGSALFRAAVQYAADGSAAGNRPPTVTAPADRTVLLGESTELMAQVSDDGLPLEPGAVTVSWDGPPGVQFADPTSATTIAGFDGAGTYPLEVRASDGELTTVDTVVVTVRDPALSRRALFITSGDTPPAVDQPIVGRLRDLGFDVVPADDDDATAADAAAADLVVISSSISPTRFDPSIGSVAVPIVTWEARIYDELGFTRTADRSGEATQNKLRIREPGHPIGAGLSGTAVVYTGNDRISWGRPEGEATVVATLTNSTVKATVFSYEAGALMHDTAAPNRRVGLFMGMRGPTKLTGAGWDIFDAAVSWAISSNDRPSVDAGPNATIAHGDPFTLAGQVSDDGRPTQPGTVSTNWSGPATVSFADATALDTGVTFPGPGTYSLTLTADDGAAIASDSVEITVTANPLTAIIEAQPATGYAPLQVAFDGSNSTDPGGAVVSHAWDFGNGQTATGALASSTYDGPGTYTVRLTVTDSAGLSAETTTQVTVSSRPPTAVATADVTYLAEPGTITFDGSLSTQTGGTITAYAWDFGDNSTGSGASASHRFGTNGIFLVTLTVTGTGGLTDTDTLLIRIGSAPPERVTAGLTAFYDFGEGSGTVLGDTSGRGAALDLTITDPAATSWLPGGGLRVNGETIIVSSGPATKVNQAIRASGELTIEAWIDPLAAVPAGPGRIVTVSPDDSVRNLAITQGQVGQPADRIEARMLSGHSTGQGYPGAETPEGSLGDELTHVVFTRSSDGRQQIWLDGQLADEADIGGDLSRWDVSFPLALAADPDGQRPWAGDYHLVAVYDRALSQSEICRNNAAGPGRTLSAINRAPVPCLILDAPTGAPVHTVNVDGSFSADHDGNIVSYLWDFGDGSTASGESASHSYGIGDHTVQLTVTDDDGASTTASTVVVVRNTPLLPPKPVGFDDRLGFRASGGLFELEDFLIAEDWLGLPIGLTVQFTDRSGPNTMQSNAAALAAPQAALPLLGRVELSLTVPLGFGNANAKTRAGRTQIRNNLVATASGEHDAHYLQVARDLADGGFGDAVIRMAHEFNGQWPPYSSRQNETQFIAAWRHVHELFTSVSPSFRFDWNSTRGSWTNWSPQAYPGDDYVDIVSMDVYWRVDPGEPTWNQSRWRNQFLGPMDAMLAFAQSHGKPVAVPEWALIGADEPRFIERMYTWMAQLPSTGPGSLVYQSYFDAGSSKERLADHPASKRTFIELFGPATG